VHSLGLSDLLINFCPARILHFSHPNQIFFGASQFLIRNFPALLFFGTFASFRLNSFSLVLSALSGHLFLSLAPFFLLDVKRVFSGQSGSLNRRPARFFFGP